MISCTKRLFHTAVFIHRDLGLVAQMLSIDVVGDIDYAPLALRATLNKVFVTDHESHVFGVVGEENYDRLDFEGDGWKASLPNTLVTTIETSADTTPSHCFRCALASYLQEQLNTFDRDITITSVNVVRTPPSDACYRLGLNRVSVTPISVMVLDVDEVRAVAGFHLGYSHRDKRMEVRKPYTVINTAEDVRVSLPTDKHAALHTDPIILGQVRTGRRLSEDLVKLFGDTLAAEYNLFDFGDEQFVWDC